MIIVATNSVTKYWLEVNENHEWLDKPNTQIFHHNMANIFVVMQKVRVGFQNSSALFVDHNSILI